jgi:hypothetical protein
MWLFANVISVLLKVLCKGFSPPQKNTENIYHNAEGAGQWKSLLNAYTELTAAR